MTSRRMTISLILAIVVLIGIVAIPEDVMAQVATQWLVHNKITDEVKVLGPGALVNNDPVKYEVAMRVTGLAPNEVYTIKQCEDDGWWPDDLGSTNDYAADASGTIQTPWTTPPAQTGDPGSASEWYFNVWKDGKQVGANSTNMNVTDKTIVADLEAYISEIKTAFSADVGESGGIVTVKVDGKVRKLKVAIEQTAFVDPQVEVQLVLLDPLPSGWNLEIYPTSFWINPGEEREIELTYMTPKAGRVSFYLQSTANPGSPDEFLDRTNVLAIQAVKDGAVFPNWYSVAPLVVAAGGLAFLFRKRLSRKT